MAVSEWIYKQLKNNAGVSAITTDIYPIIRQETNDLPAVVYELYDVEPVDSKGLAPTVDVWDCDITAFAETYTECETLSEAVRTALDRQSGTQGSTTVDDCWVDGYDTEPYQTNEIFALTYSFKIRAKR